jgi:nitrate reductase gamma subunit
MQRTALALVEYLLGFIALAVFAAIAFTGPSMDEKFILAFKAGAALAVIELAALFYRAKPANRLIVGANLWLLAGGVAALLEQWWLLKAYQRIGEASLFLSMLAVGVVTTAASKAGFVGTFGDRKAVLVGSLALLVGVAAALAAAVYFRGDVKFAAAVPVIALSWFNRLVNVRVRDVTNQPR